MKKALVTGSAGFIGRHITRALRARGYDVTTYDSAYGYDMEQLFTPPLSAAHKYDLVVPAAYYIGGRAGIDGERRNLARNLALDAQMFNWAVHTGQKHVLYFSSSAAYPVAYQTRDYVEAAEANGETALLREDMVAADGELWAGIPDADYGWAKLTGERLAHNAQRSGLNVSIVRPFSGYGEDQSLDYPFPAIVDRVRKGSLSVWGPPGQSRDWIHIDDLISGALAVVESGYQLPVNLCTGRAVEMGEMASLVYRLLHGQTHEESSDGHSAVQYEETKPTGVFYRVGDPTIFNKFYTPKIRLEDGIRRALAK